MSFVCTWFCKLSLPWSYCKSVFRSNFAAALKVTLVGWLRSFLNPRKSMLPYKSCLWKFLPFWLSYSKTYFLGNSAKIWDSCFFLFLSRKSFAPECTTSTELLLQIFVVGQCMENCQNEKSSTLGRSGGRLQTLWEIFCRRRIRRYSLLSQWVVQRAKNLSWPIVIFLQCH